MKPLYRGTLALLGSTLMYGSFGVLFRVIGFSIPLFYQAFFRALLAALLSGIALLLWKQWQKVNKEVAKWISWRTLIGVAATLCFFTAVNNVAVGTTYFVFYGGSTIAGYVFGKFWFQEQLTKVKIISLFLGLVGLALVYSVSSLSFSPFFLFLATIAGVFTAIWNIISKRIPEKYSALQLTFIDSGLSCLLLAIISLVFREVWILPTVNAAWRAIAILGVFFTLTGTLIVYGFRLLGAQLGSLVMLSEIVFALIFSFIFYREIPGASTLLGGLLIMLAIALPELPKKYFSFLYENRRQSTR
jgi:drug/metabolite transporter (DMT)-like permease